MATITAERLAVRKSATSPPSLAAEPRIDSSRSPKVNTAPTNATNQYWLSRHSQRVSTSHKRLRGDLWGDLRGDLRGDSCPKRTGKSYVWNRDFGQNKLPTIDHVVNRITAGALGDDNLFELGKKLIGSILWRHETESIWYVRKWSPWGESGYTLPDGNRAALRHGR